MLKLVYENVPTLQEEYEAYIRGSCDEEMEAMLVHLGRGPFPRTLYWFNNLGMWVSFHRPRAGSGTHTGSISRKSKNRL